MNPFLLFFVAVGIGAVLRSLARLGNKAFKPCWDDLLYPTDYATRREAGVKMREWL